MTKITTTKIAPVASEIVAVSTSKIRGMIYSIRNQQVMFDFDLAQIYGYEVRAMNQQVKRNSTRFPEDFMFQLTQEEVNLVKSQIVTSSNEKFFSGQMGGRRKPPYVFTEQGIYMLGSVLKGEVAEQQTVFIMRAFREMRHFISTNALLFERISSIELRQMEYEKKTDKKLEQIFEYISEHEESNQKVFFEGQIYDAFSLIADLIQKADKEIMLIDGYVDIGTLNLLSKKKENVEVIIYTQEHSRLSKTDIENFNAQYPSLKVKYTKAFHDRFLILDRETAYHVGASIKDAGKKCFGINLIQDTGIIKDILQRLELETEE